jgi:choline dehydrogenase-like flavoprotein
MIRPWRGGVRRSRVLPLVMRETARRFSAFVQEKLTEMAYGLPTERARDLQAQHRMRPREKGKWFTPDEEALIETLTTLLVPSSEDRPGMAEVEVLGEKPTETLGGLICESELRQVIYSRGLAAIHRLAFRWYRQRLDGLPPEIQLEFLTRLFEREKQGKRRRGLLGTAVKHCKRVMWMLDGSFEAVELLPMLVQDAHAVFFTSRVSWVWLGYDGPPMPLGYPDPTKPRSVSKTQPTLGLEETARLLERSTASRPTLGSRRDAPVDVVIVGSGAGGAVVAKELGEAGVSVVVIEAGRKYDPYRDYPTHRDDFEITAADPFGADDARRDTFTTGGGRAFNYSRVKGVGGTTLRYVAVSPRLHESDFRVRSEDGVADDWPLRYEDLEPYYTRVEYELGVSGADGVIGNPFDPPRSKPYPTPPHPFNLASRAVKLGAKRLGWHMVREPVAIPSREWGGRPACIGAGTCQLGCAIAAKSSMDVTYIPKAIASGNVDIRAECVAREIVIGREGKVRGVVYLDKEGGEHRIDAKVVVVAGNAVETPRLLLMSSSPLFPDGLANSSGLVGMNFMEHLGVFAHGRLTERTDPWRGIPTGGMIQDFYSTSPTHGFARGWTILLTSHRHWPLSVASGIPGWGASHMRRVEERFGRAVCVASVGEQLPDPSNRVALDPVERDSFGLPAPLLINEPRENDRAMIEAISARLRELLDAAGAQEIWGTRYNPGSSSHYLGTCRMGSDPGRSVVDCWGRCHDVPNLFIADGSVFVTGGAVNPALTISALATRTAEEIIRSAMRLDV